MQTSLFPSGAPYQFPFLNIRPLRFGELLEYTANVDQKDPVEKFYADYCLLKAQDPNVDKLLLTDLDFAFFVLQVKTVANDEVYHSTIKCPRCGHEINGDIAISNLKYKRLDPELLDGLDVKLGGNIYKVRIPTVAQFMKVFTNYRRFKRITDVRLIKIISLFEQSETNVSGIENLVANATNKDIKILVALESILLDPIESYHVTCKHCVDTHEPTDAELSLKAEELGKKIDDLDIDDLDAIKREYGGVEVSLQGLSSAVFRDILRYTKIDSTEISVRKPSGVQKH